MTLLNFLVIATSILSVYAAQDDPGPQTFSLSTPLPPISTHRPRYVMRDAILYLTPSQIKALEATHGLNKVVPMGNANDGEELQKAQYSDEELLNLGHLIQKQLTRQNIYQSQTERTLQNKQPTPIVEPNTETPIAFSPEYEQPLPPQPLRQILVQQIPLPLSKPKSNYYLPTEGNKGAVPESYSFIKMFTDKEIHEIPKIQLYHPHPLDQKLRILPVQQNLEIQEDPILHKKYKLVPYEYVTEKPNLEKPFTALDLLKGELQVNNELAEQIKYQVKKIERQNIDFPKYISALKYAPKFEDQKHATEYQKQLLQIEKDNAAAKAEAIRKSTPVVIHEDISVKKFKPQPVPEHLSIPTQQNFFVPVLKPEVKIPQQYAVPLQIIHSIPLSIVKPEKPSFEIEKQVHVPSTKNQFKVDQPYSAENYLPVEEKKQVPLDIPLHNSEKLTYIRHVWKH